MSKNKVKTDKLLVIMYRELFDIIEDETGHPSYRKYLDKVVQNIFGLEAIGTGFLMANNQFKYLKKLINNPDSKQFCQMLLREDDTKALLQLVRAAYDISQIANKPKKKVSTKDIKSYRYLTDLYTKTVKKLRKKYKVEYIDSKKSYKDKYSDLDKFIGDNKVKTPYYSFGDDLDEDDDDEYESLSDLIEDSDDNFINDDFDISEIPAKFIVGKSKKSSKRNSLILDGDNDDLELYDESDSEDEDSIDISPANFQKYTLSMFEMLAKNIESINNKIDNLSTSDTENQDLPHRLVIIDDEKDNTETSKSDDVTMTEEDIPCHFPTPDPAIDPDIKEDESNLTETTPEPKDISTLSTKDYDKLNTEQLITVFNNMNQVSIESDSTENQET